MLARAVTPATCIAENFAVIVSAALLSGFKFTFLASFSRLPNPFAESLN